MPAVRSAILIGFDLLAKLGITLQLPPSTENKHKQCNALTTGLETHSTEKKKQLQAFLETKQAKYKTVSSPINQATHHLKVKEGNYR
ncbi:hypothetical protein PUN28_020826 [Cardiocondyla obscurior]|uniref:Uncharacterized protein n=1 Tax=Cardiocondyla obscurior TaxID=286306 RepID=A0AAW2E854_9HYME